MKQAKVLNDKDIKIMKAVINDNRYAVRNMTMFLLALNCGLRAKEIASIDRISGGRFILGIGAGWNAEEMENHGIEYNHGGYSRGIS